MPSPPSGQSSAPSNKAKGPATSDDPVTAIVEEALGDPQKRLEAFATWKVPRYSAEYEDDDKEPLLAFLKDMQSGTEQASSYIKYIQEMAERAEKFGDLAGLQDVGRAAGGLKKISSQIGSGLKKFSGKLKTAQDAVRWVIELDKFADASSAMDPKDRQSVERWIKQMQRLWDASAPFAQWAQGKLVASAFAGSEAAAAASATMAIVGAQIFIGMKALEVGVKNVNAYLKRMDDIMREIEIESGQRARPQIPPPPPYPGDWKTREELKAEAKANEVRGLRQAVQNAEDAKAKKKADEARAAAAQFDAEVFPKMYMERRSKIAAQVLASLRAVGNKTVVITDLKSDARPPESRWWDCLMSDDSDAGRFDPQARIWLHRPKGKVNIEEAKFEIEEFKRVKPPCPFFAEFRNPALAKYVKSKVAL